MNVFLTYFISEVQWGLGAVLYGERKRGRMYGYADEEKREGERGGGEGREKERGRGREREREN
eukprot:708370-Amorphochlora_amoeboformis.AAC.1